MWLSPARAVALWGQYYPTEVFFESPDRTLTYAAAAREMHRCYRWLEGKAEAGQRVALLFDDSCVFLTTVLACMMRGLRPVVLQASLAPAVLSRHLNETRPALIVCDSFGQDTAKACQSDVPIAMAPEYSTEEASLLSDTLSILRAPSHQLMTSEWGVLFSSGSTGDPKAIVHAEIGLVSELMAWILELGLTKHVRFLVARPLFYTGGFALSLATVLARGTIVSSSRMVPTVSVNDLCKLFELGRFAAIDWCFLIPDQARHLMTAFAQWPSVPSPRNFLFMGAPIAGKEKVAFRGYTGSNVHESWGNTEGLGSFADDDLLDTEPDSIGRPFVGETLFIVEKATGTILGPREIGHIAGTDEVLFSQYVGDQESTGRSGVFVSEDMGYIAETGNFYLAGRDVDAIKIAGSTVFCQQIERAIQKHFPGLVLAVVRRGSRLLLAIEASSSIEIGAVASLVKSTLGDQLGEGARIDLQSILDIEGFTVLPRLATGKIDRRALTREQGR